MNKPIIGLTMALNENKYSVSQDYFRAVERAGGIPVGIGYNSDASEALKNLDGLILTGGGDFSVNVLNGAYPDKRADGISAFRDIGEAELIKKAYEADIPTLGICRGAQIMNLAMGGKIIQHIEGHIQRNPAEQGYHNVNFSCESLLKDIYNSWTILANSFHHQAISTLGEGLIQLGYCEDGCTEAIGAPDKRFFIGVQWHPERQKNDRLIESFISCCALTL